MEMMSVAKARKIMGIINPELSDEQMEDLIKLFYTMARIEVDLFNKERGKEEIERKIR